MDTHESRICRKIRKWLNGQKKAYDFWFVYDSDGHACSWEGGLRTFGRFPLPFRNQYTLLFGRRNPIKNWSDLNLRSNGNVCTCRE